MQINQLSQIAHSIKLPFYYYTIKLIEITMWLKIIGNFFKKIKDYGSCRFGTWSISKLMGFLFNHILIFEFSYINIIRTGN